VKNPRCRDRDRPETREELIQIVSMPTTTFFVPASTPLLKSMVIAVA
jgi:hypothetical protein